MSVCVAEYFGQKTEQDHTRIDPVIGDHQCPFMSDVCVKLLRHRYKPRQIFETCQVSGET